MVYLVHKLRGGRNIMELELQGKHNNAKVFTHNIEETAVGQVIEMLNQSFTEGEQVRIMPDVHAGKGATVGTTMTIKNQKVVPNLVGVDIGCLDKDTEILTPEGWIKISEYSNQEILTYDVDTSTGCFKKPNAFIIENCEEFYHFKNGKGLDQMVSEEHKMLVYSGYKGKGYTHSFMQPAELIGKKLDRGYYGFKTAFNLESAEGLDLSDDEIRLIAMISADGSVRKVEYGFTKYELHFSKERKVERAKLLLEKVGILFKHTYSDKTKKHYVYFTTPTHYSKDLTIFYKASAPQLKVLHDESLLWDGRINDKDKLYFSSNKENADVIQFALNANDKRAGLYTTEYTQENRKDSYQVRETKNNVVGYAGSVTKVSAVEGKKYCFNTSTGAFLARRNNHVFITGNCGIMVSFLGKLQNTDDREWGKLDNVVNSSIPAGFNKRNSAIDGTKTDKMLENLTFYAQGSENLWNNIRLSLGTLGGGNHFIELAKDDEDNFYLLVHTGSRSLGLNVAKYHQAVAENYHKENPKVKEELVNKLKAEGRQKDIQTELKKLVPEVKNMDLAYLEGVAVSDYLNDMDIAQRYAVANRTHISDIIIKKMGWTLEDRFDSMHNYIDIANEMLRKGATDAKEGMRLVIPLNMRDGSILGVGKGNPDWNYSAPHGAGRIMSRSKAKENIELESFVETMKDVYSTSVGQSTLDEAPFAYKPSQEIIEAIEETVEIEKIVKPVYNFKSH